MTFWGIYHQHHNQVNHSRGHQLQGPTQGYLGGLAADSKPAGAGLMMARDNISWIGVCVGRLTINSTGSLQNFPYDEHGRR